jgi:hypothetical protein
MALAPTHLVVDEARLHLQAIAAEPPRTLIQALVAISRLALWQQSLTLRLHDPGLDRAGLATLADHARLWLDAAMGRCWIGEYRWMLHMTERIRRGEPKYSDALVGDFGLGLPSWTKPLGLHLLVYRSARSGILMGVLDIQQAWVRNPAPSHRYADMKNLDRVWSSVPAWDLRHRFERLLLPAVGMVGRSWAEADTHLRLLAAELRGEPWPIDPTDPAGKPVRRIERDGRLIGFYLLKDGTDDGGHTSKDKCTALYEPLGKPMAADPLVSDPP